MSDAPDNGSAAGSPNPPGQSHGARARAHRFRSGGLAAWSASHPIGISMVALALIVLGAFSLQRLGVDLLPHIIYPEVRVRVLEPGVPGNIMEDRITRQLEEQLAITEDAISVQSRSTEGRSEVNLTFRYGKDIDIALRDASSRLDRAKRFLPDTIDPPVIYKLDPSQIPVMELAISSELRDPVELRTWIDYRFSKWFLNLPGVAAVEVGGAPSREIIVQPDQQRLAGLGMTLVDVMERLEKGNLEAAGGSLKMLRQEIGSRTDGRFRSVEDIANLPVETTPDGGNIPLRDVADVIDGNADERLRVRLNRQPGLKVSMQKQPQANTVSVVDHVREQLRWLRDAALIPTDIAVEIVQDQSLYVRQALNNATQAALSGAVLAMLVVYVFLGDLRRTLIIGTGIPIGIMVALILMAGTGLTLNVMTLGGLALGVGLLVDNTIVMQENLARHQLMGKSWHQAAADAAAEVNSAIVASTSTNLAAVLPFLFIGGLVGLLFRELIATISAAIVASLVVALTLVPALSARIGHDRKQPRRTSLRKPIDATMSALANGYGWLLKHMLRPWVGVLVVIAFVAGLFVTVPTVFMSEKQVFLPEIDDGRISARLVADSGISLNEMDRIVARLEGLFLAQPEVETAFSQIGGFVFGRSQYQRSNRGWIRIQLVPSEQRRMSSTDFVKRMKKAVRELELVGVRVRMRNDGIRGIRLSSGDDDVSIRVQGNDLNQLARIGDQLVERLRDVEGLSNLQHSAEDVVQELSVVVDRERAAVLGLDIEAVSQAVRVALQGIVVTDYLEGDRQFDVRLRLPAAQMSSPRDVESILLFPAAGDRPPVYLGEVADVKLVDSPADIRRDRQQRIIEVSASIAGGATLGEVSAGVTQLIREFEMPDGYTVYDGGAAETLATGNQLAGGLLGIAVFLVLVVMAVQYESLRNPLIILVSIPFAVIGVGIGIVVMEMPISMPIWLGLIMLTGIVVNNAIVLVEYIEIARERGRERLAAIVEAGRLRLRPILMTTLTTVFGMMPLAIGFGEGSEMLRPLAVTIVSGLAFSVLVSLLLVPTMYMFFGWRGELSRSPSPLSDPMPDQAGGNLGSAPHSADLRASA